MKPTFEKTNWFNECVTFSLCLDLMKVMEKTTFLQQSIGILKIYQQEEVQFLPSLVTSGLGAVLGYDMGTFAYKNS